jgi:precorrin-6B C5,15-methyltransferase / cobalt-precorrin-6B C5,C15-methyltransferase
MSAWLNVIGVGEDGIEALPRALQALIARAELIVGGERHLAMVSEARAEKQSWDSPLSLTIDAIWSRRGSPVVVLATGDPMHFGIGVALAKRVPAEEMAIHPHVSAFSLAAARMRWPLADTGCLTIHGRPLDLLAGAVAPDRRLLLLSHDGASPTEVARRLTELGYGASEVTVLEHMGGARERIYTGRADAWAHPRAADLNTLAVLCVANDATRPLTLGAGLPDDAFEHDGQLTKREVRAATLSALRPLPGQVLWDVGAGCGSIAIEWLRTDRSLNAIAIEPDSERQRLIAQNAGTLGVPHLKIVGEPAPDVYGKLPTPDVVFIGGGLTDKNVMEHAWERLPRGGRLVANAVTAEGEAKLFKWHTWMGGEMSRIAVLHLAPLGNFHAWRPLLPVTQYWVDKK